MKNPQCIVIAGPNGSGKTSIYEKMLPPGEFVNADVIAREALQGVVEGKRNLAAGRIAVRRVRQIITQRRDFAIETTLSGRYGINVMSDAKTAGYNVGLVYVAVDTPERSFERVKFRVATGGHPVPRADIYRRYGRSLENLVAALRMADEFAIIDNSARQPKYVCELLGDLSLPEFDDALPLHRTLVKIVSDALYENPRGSNVVRPLFKGTKPRDPSPE